MNDRGGFEPNADQHLFHGPVELLRASDEYLLEVFPFKFLAHVLFIPTWCFFFFRES